MLITSLRAALHFITDAQGVTDKVQAVTSAMAAALTMRSPSSTGTINRQPRVFFEIYSFDYLPDKGDPFDPTDAIALFSYGSYSWLGHSYRRQVVSWGSISRFVDSKFNNCDITFDNSDLFMSQFILTQDVEGLRLVIRYVDAGVAENILNSVVIFVGRLEKPSSIDENECSITAKQDLASVNYEIPRRTFSAQDPRGRSPNDPLYEGFQFTGETGLFKYSTVVTKRFLGFFSKKHIEIQTQQWSSETGTTQDQVVPLIFGRCQMELLAAIWADVGFFITGLFIAAGHKITSFSNVTVQSPNFLTDDRSQIFTQTYVDAHTHLGDPGGTGTNATPETVDGSLPSNTALLSRTAYLGLKPFGPESPIASTPNPGEDSIPTITAIVLGEADLPDGSNDFVLKGFTDNNSYLTRLILTAADILGQDGRLIDDDSCVETAAVCDEILIDDTSAEILALSTADADALDDGLFNRFNSSGVVDTKYQKFVSGATAVYPGTVPRTDALRIDPGDPGGTPCPSGQHLDPFTLTCVPNGPGGIVPPPVDAPTIYRRRYTFNAPLTAKVTGVDFLFNTVLPSFRGFMVVGPDGRLRIRSERPADSSFLRSNASAGASTIAINDVEAWRTSKQGLALIGVGLVTSETRTVTAATYSSLGGSITLAGSGSGITLTASGGTLGGGSTTVPYSGTLTVSGSASAGDVLTATIDGIVVAYTLNSGDSLASAAAMLAAAINAKWSLKQYTRAVAAGAVVTVYSKLGTLTLSLALTNAHVALLASPTVAPTASAVGSGTMTPGVYDLAYSFTSGTGETFISPRSQVTITAGQKISVTTITLPGGAAGTNWYLSKAPNDTTLGFLINNVGTGFTINVLPSADAAREPTGNSAGEETIRVMASFTQENIRQGKFRWPLADKESSINQVKIKYREASADFGERELFVNDYVHQARIGKVNSVGIDGSGIDNYNQASRLANSRLSKEREGNFFCEWDTDEAGLLFEEGDVVCVTDVTGGFVNLPLRIEQLNIAENLDVTFTGRLYSTIMYSDATGQHPIVIPTSLKYLNSPPPVATNLVLVETFAGALRGDFDFGGFGAIQKASLYLKRDTAPADADFKRIDIVLPDNTGGVESSVTSITRVSAVATVTMTAHGYLTGRRVVIAGATQPEYNGSFSITVTDADHFTFAVSGTPATPATGTITSTTAGAHGSFEIAGLADGVYEVKIATESIYGYSATSGHPTATITMQPQAITDDTESVDVYGDRIITFVGHPRPPELPEDYSVEIWSNTPGAGGSTLIRTLPVSTTTGHPVLLIRPHGFTIT